MRALAWVTAGGAVVLVVYAYVLYPLALAALGALRRPRDAPGFDRWPSISIVLPVYNERAEVRDLLESVLALDYPGSRQILVISDASDDGTDEIVSEYADRGVELVRLPERGGKTRAENEAADHVTGEIVVTTDASTRIPPNALEPLIDAFSDPGVGVASGRDVSVTRLEDDGNLTESGYVGYEMWVRSLETRAAGIVGASGCYYAIRRELHREHVPDGLSRDFASALVAREHGYRAVSVNEAVCMVPRTASVRREYRRKVRTVTRGMQTLWHKRHLLNPLRHGLFSWMLFSHKVSRWLIPWAALAALVALTGLALSLPALALVPVGAVLLGLLATAGWLWRGDRVPKALALPAFLAASNIGVLAAWVRAVRGMDHAVWEPTRRAGGGASSPEHRHEMPAG